MVKKLLISPVLVAILLVSVISVSTVFAVPTITLTPSGGDDTAAIHTAIANIDDGGTIYFEAGTFHANIVIDDPDKSFSLVGAGQGVTILDGNTDGSPGGDGIVLSIKNTNADNDIILVLGFTITNGHSTSYGAGAFFDSSSPNVVNCTFTGNSADTGAGMYNCLSSPTVTNCTFSNNSAVNGAGMCNQFTSYPLITFCTFTGNTATYSGGGMLNTQSTVPLIVSCTFSGNHASNNGGGMRNTYSASVTIQNCTFSSNTSDSNGGGMSTY
jgi:parallel beta-helix repeat protein